MTVFIPQTSPKNQLMSAACFCSSNILRAQLDFQAQLKEWGAQGHGRSVGAQAGAGCLPIPSHFYTDTHSYQASNPLITSCNYSNIISRDRK